MSEAAKAARSAMKSKAERLTKADPSQKVDSSTWSPPEALDADVKTGARPLVKRLYKKGGKVVGKADGVASKARADRKARKSGGRIGKEAEDRSKRYLTPDNLINRDVRMANEAREGKKHVGAFKKGGKAFPDLTGDGKVTKADVLKGRGVLKKGGKAHKLGGGPIGDNPVSTQSREMGKAAGMMKKGGRAHKASGGQNPMTQDRTPTNVPAGKMVPASQAPWKRDLDADSRAAAPTKSPDYPDKAKSLPRKEGGKVKNWEGSKKDEAQDRMLAKKYGISMKAWEKSAKDKKHDKQQSMEGLKKGGRAAKYSGGGVFSGSSYPGKVPGAVGGRHAHAKGGKSEDDSKGGSFLDMFDNSKMIKNLEEKGAVAGITKEDFAKKFGVDPKNIGSRIIDFKDGEGPRVDYYRTDRGLFGGSSTPTADMPAKKAAAASAKSAPAYKPASGPMPTSTSLGMRDPQQQMEMNRQDYARAAGTPTASYELARAAGTPTSGYKLAEAAGTPTSAYDYAYNPYRGAGSEDPLAYSQQASANRMRGAAPAPVMPEPQGFGALDRSLQNLIQQEQIDASRRRMAAQQGVPAFKKGGRAKGKTNINIVIATGKGQQEPMGMPNAPIPAPKAMPVPPPMPPMPPQGGAPMPPMPPAGPQGMPMPRKSGGRTTHVIDHAAGGGKGRMEKIKAYGHKAGKVVGKK